MNLAKFYDKVGDNIIKVGDNIIAQGQEGTFSSIQILEDLKAGGIKLPGM